MSPPPGDEEVGGGNEHIPSALEEVLAYKEIRVREVGHTDHDSAAAGKSTAIIDKSLLIYHSFLGGVAISEESQVHQVDESLKEDIDKEDKKEEQADTEESKPKNRNQKKKKKKKRSKRTGFRTTEDTKDEEADENEDLAVEIEYVQEEIVYDEKNPYFKQFAKIFDIFKIKDEKTLKKEEEEEAKRKELQRMIELKKVPKFEEEEIEEKKEPGDDDKPKISKRKQKQLSRMSVAELKQCVARPDVVEMHDVTAKDPKLLVLLKATRNSVPVPRHWCAKRKYLQVHITKTVSLIPFMVDFTLLSI